MNEFKPQNQHLKKIFLPITGHLFGPDFIRDTIFIKSNSSQIETIKKILYNIENSAFFLTVTD